MRIFRQFELDPRLFVSSAITLLILPLPWCIALIFSAGFHEICHLIALRICGCQSPQIRIGPSGAVIYSAPLSIGKALLCTLAGPLGQFFAACRPEDFCRKQKQQKKADSQKNHP